MQTWLTSNHYAQASSKPVVAAMLRLLAVMAISNSAFSQEPSAAFKQADAAYRAGQAALAQRDLSAAQADFEQVVRLAPQAEQGHSALGAVLVSRGRHAGRHSRTSKGAGHESQQTASHK